VSHSAISLGVLGVVVVLFVWNRLPVEIVAIGSAIVLYFTGVLDLGQVVSGFGDATVVLIAALFVVSEGLDASGVTAWAGQVLVARAGDSPRRLLLLTMLMAAGLTALINLNGSVAALLPVAVVVAMRQRQPPSRLLMPLAFAGSAGSLLLLTGSPVNLLVSEAAANAGVGGIGYAEFALVGVPLVLGTVAIVLALGPRLLPARASRALPPDLSGHARTLVEQYAFGDIYRLRLREGSPLADRPRASPGLDEYAGLTVVSVLAGGVGPPVDHGVLAVGDVLVVSGDADTVNRSAIERRLAVEDARSREYVTRTLLNRDVGVVEVVIPPRSSLVGMRVRPGSVLARGDLVVLAVQREGRDRGNRDTDLAVGDSVLVEGTWEALDQNVASPNVLVVDSPELVRRQTVPMGRGSGRAIAILAGMVILLASGAIPAVLAALLAAGAMVVVRVLTMEQAYRGVSWTTVVLVGGIIPLSTAIRVSGAGEAVGHLIVQAVGAAGPYALLAAIVLLTVVFGQLISNTATALIMIPIAVSAAAQLHVSARPVLISLCVACAASFLTPVATPANLMVMGPAGYRFGDYWKLGLPMVALFVAVAVLLVPLIWPL